MIFSLRTAVLAFFSLILLSANAQLKYIEGRDYEKLPQVIEETENPKVIEFFWFGCPHCNKVKGYVEEWSKNDLPEGVEFEVVPATMKADRWYRSAKVFYTIQAIKRPELVSTFFDAIFKERKLALLGNDAAVKDFFLKNDVDVDVFDKAWNSLEVKQNLARAEKLFETSGIDGVPAFIVNGKYSVPLKGDNEQDYANTFRIIHTLLKQDNFSSKEDEEEFIDSEKSSDNSKKSEE